MKFLYVAPRFHPNQVPIINGLIEKGNAVVFCVRYCGVTEEHGKAHVRCVSESSIMRLLRFIWKNKNSAEIESKLVFWFIPNGREVKEIIKEYNPDVVVLRERNLLSLFFYRICKRKKIKCLLYNQSPRYILPEKKYIEVGKKIWARLFPKYRITVSDYSEYPREKNKYKFSRNSYLLPHIPRMTESGFTKNYFVDGKINIFDTGKYRKYKNHKVLIEAIRLLRQDGFTNFHLVIVGQVSNSVEEAYYSELQNMLKSYELCEFVDLLKEVPYNDIDKFYRESDIFVLPSLTELASVSIADAMSYGLATISTNKNGTAHYIEDNKDGLIFVSDNAQDLASKLEIYLNNKDLIIEHGKKAHNKMITEFTFEKYYQKLMKVIDLL